MDDIFPTLIKFFKLIIQYLLTLIYTRGIINYKIKTNESGADNMTKQLEIGKNYGEIFGLNEKTGTKMIYNGGISWTAINGGQEFTKDSQQTTDNAVEYINRPSYGTGIKA